MTLLKYKGVLWPRVWPQNIQPMVEYFSTIQIPNVIIRGLNLELVYTKNNDRATVTACSLHPSTWKWRPKDCEYEVSLDSKFKVNLGYTAGTATRKQTER